MRFVLIVACRFLEAVGGCSETFDESQVTDGGGRFRPTFVQAPERRISITIALPGHECLIFIGTGKARF